MRPSIKRTIQEHIAGAPDPIAALNDLREFLHSLSPIQQPVDLVRWVRIEDVCPNDYNPNSVARVEMKLLHTSIKHDGYTQPVVTIWDEEKGKYVIVDGFHRYYTCKTSPDIQEQTQGRIPVTVIAKGMNDRMASTVRHNRARGKHSIAGMSSMVFSMLENGWSDADICNELGMEANELVRLKHITGFSKLFEDTEYRQSWESKFQVRERIKAEKAGEV